MDQPELEQLFSAHAQAVYGFLAYRVPERDELLRALSGLDVTEGEIVALRYGADLRLDDIAEVTGLPATTVQGRLYSGLRKLHETLVPGQSSSTPSPSA